MIKYVFLIICLASKYFLRSVYLSRLSSLLFCCSNLSTHLFSEIVNLIQLHPPVFLAVSAATPLAQQSLLFVFLLK